MNVFIYFICYIIHLNLFTETVSQGSSDKNQGIQRGIKRKRRKCSDQEKEGELSFSYQSLMAAPPVFFIFVCPSMFFGAFHRTFHFGAKRLTELGKIRIGKRQKGRPPNGRLVIFAVFNRCAYVLVNDWTGRFCCPGRISVASGDLSSSKFNLLYYLIYRKVKAVELEVFERRVTF